MFRVNLVIDIKIPGLKILQNFFKVNRANKWQKTKAKFEFSSV